jgi:DEAD/DEAH box helicase domain-containing protein
MDLESHNVRVEHTDVDYYTQPQKVVSLAVIGTLATKNDGGVTCAFGDVEVMELYTGYKIKRRDRVIGVEPLSLPPLTFRTKAFWFNPPAGVEHAVAGSARDFAGGLHGAEHAIIALMPLHVMCDRWDIGGLSSPAFGDSGEPVIFVYDAYEGGVGLAEKAYEILPELFATAFELVRDCHCQEGCPSCIYSPKCGNDNQPLDKEATVLILRELCRDTEKMPVQVPVQGASSVTKESPPCIPAVNLQEWSSLQVP